MASKIKVDELETADGTGTIALQNQLSGMTTASLPTLTDAQMPAGSVLQVVNATHSTEAQTSSNSWSDTGLTATITPTSSSNKILVIFSLNGVAKESSDTSVKIQSLYNIGGGSYTGATSFGTRSAYTGGNDKIGIGSVSGSLLLSLSTTSAVNVKLQQASNSNSATAIVQETNATSTITLMEIAG